ncbi:hypothetical protein CHAB381_1371 [Campylobacter hominis ATCC BAA-381]|uniref:Uncharacterized protein n=1 Tax=Campylobacter hominis (strain ATCC BAA-381 / DSM 21671 / CCUG 45161 / LMG 19568 / NCTC 13146 / CH001A) TaxID=360107 RepID=A7I329_CAMHC|nr:hypothetical protein CHAB381_1371 [Campylobacter hominis ATCC BAA-381]
MRKFKLLNIKKYTEIIDILLKNTDNHLKNKPLIVKNAFQ